MSAAVSPSAAEAPLGSVNWLVWKRIRMSVSHLRCWARSASEAAGGGGMSVAASCCAAEAMWGGTCTTHSADTPQQSAGGSDAGGVRARCEPWSGT